MTEDKDGKNARAFGGVAFDSAIVVLVVTLLGYLVIYNRLSAYCSSFLIPAEFIEVRPIDFSMIAESIVTWFGVFLFLAGLMGVLGEFLKSYELRLGRGLWWSFLVYLAYVSQPEFKSPRFLYVSLGAFVVIELILEPILRKRNGQQREPGLGSKYLEILENFSSLSFRNKFSTLSFLMLVLLSLLLALGQSMGKWDAATKDKFLLIDAPLDQSQRSRLLVLARFGDRFACAPLSDDGVVQADRLLISIDQLSSQATCRMRFINRKGLSFEGIDTVSH